MNVDHRVQELQRFVFGYVVFRKFSKIGALVKRLTMSFVYICTATSGVAHLLEHNFI